MHRATAGLPFLLVLTVCSGSRADSQPKPGVVSGRAVDAAGRPLANVAIWNGVQAVWSSPAKGSTGADGSYRVEKLNSRFIYKTFAWHQLSYRGKSYCLRLAPDGDGSEFGGKEGAVRNFRWQLAGPMGDGGGEPGDPGTTWGADVRLFWDFADGEYDGTLVLELEPDGPLVDGSKGKHLTREVDLTRSAFVTDVPIGAYRVSGLYKKRGGGSEKVRFGDDGATATPEALLEFKPNDGPRCGSATTANGVERAFLRVHRP